MPDPIGMKSLNILVLTAYPPALGVDGGGMRMYHNLRVLAARHRVTLISFIERDEQRCCLNALERMGIEVNAVLRRPQPDASLWVPVPREHAEFNSDELRTLVRRTMSQRRFDVIQAEYLQMAQHVPADSQALRVLTEHEVMFETFRNTLAREKSWWRRAYGVYNWLVQLNYEVRICRQFHRIACMTDEDRELLGRFVSSATLRTIPIGVDSKHFSPRQTAELRPGSRILFVGNYRHPPNADAVYFFAEEVLPRIRELVPEAEFSVVGGNTSLLDLKRLDPSRGIRVVGYVDDIRTAYEGATVFVAPIRTGTGMRVKILEALSMGMAVVATRLAAQGFQTQTDPVLLVADDPESLAAETVRVLKDAVLQRNLGDQARRLIVERFDWQVLEAEFLGLVEAESG